MADYIFAEGTIKNGSVQWLKPNGDPGIVDGPTKFTNSAPELAEMVVEEDGLSVVITLLKAGDVQFVAEADADLGEGVRPVMAIANVRIIPQEVTTGLFSLVDAV